MGEPQDSKKSFQCLLSFCVLGSCATFNMSVICNVSELSVWENLLNQVIWIYSTWLIEHQPQSEVASNFCIQGIYDGGDSLRASTMVEKSLLIMHQ